MNRYILTGFLVLFLSIGLAQIAVFAHEGLHIMQFDYPEKLCYNFGLDPEGNFSYDAPYMSVEGYHGKDKDTSKFELWAYLLELVVLLVFAYIIIKILDNWRFRR